ncbi:MAG: MATE family efflux transporter [Myxococcales bacterium]|nr:MAG: MATE family efflux transporter [Myxococcales bacterium]
MTRSPLLFTILKLAWPMIIARSTQAIVGLSDALMSAPLGEAGLAAVTTGSVNTFSILTLPCGTAFILQSFSAQFAGRNDKQTNTRYAWYGLIFSAQAGLIVIALLPALPWFLHLFAYQTSVRLQIADYMYYRFIGAFAVIGLEAIGNWYAGLGKTRLHMNAGLIGMICNVFLNFLLIEGHWGAPALGAKGAGIASSIASIIAFLALLVFFLFDQRKYNLAALRTMKGSEFLRVLWFGLPHGTNLFLEFAAFTVFISVVVAQLGTTVLAAAMVVFNINTASYMPAFGVSSAGAIIAGQHIGSKQSSRVWPTLKTTILIAIAWEVTVGFFYLCIPEQLMLWFAFDQDSNEMIRIGASMLVVSATWQVFDAVSMSYGETLRAAGDTFWCMLARILLSWLFFVPLAYFSAIIFNGGYLAAMVSLLCCLVALAAILAWRFHSGAWRQISLTGNT